MSDIALFLRLQARVSAFLAELPADQLAALADGRLSFGVVDGGSGPVAVTAPVASALPITVAPKLRKPAARNVEFDAEAVVAELRACETVAEATQRLAAHNLSATNLKSVAKTLNIPSSGTKPDLARRILNLLVAARSKHAGLRAG
ncbi:hypothetical protein [Dactylosporangium sp. CS-033363]|uniref:hypothetical protein n=1 Tax=Dactylosporangium sp. CS-033363 TaxID=3239935 RepID=UPI003D8A58AB